MTVLPPGEHSGNNAFVAVNVTSGHWRWEEQDRDGDGVGQGSKQGWWREWFGKQTGMVTGVEREADRDGDGGGQRSRQGWWRGRTGKQTGMMTGVDREVERDGDGSGQGSRQGWWREWTGKQTGRRQIHCSGNAWDYNATLVERKYSSVRSANKVPHHSVVCDVVNG